MVDIMIKFRVGATYRTTLNNDTGVVIKVVNRTLKTITVILQPGAKYAKEIKTKLTCESTKEETATIKGIYFCAGDEL